MLLCSNLGVICHFPTVTAPELMNLLNGTSDLSSNTFLASLSCLAPVPLLF